jgi:O-antigen ligase
MQIAKNPGTQLQQQRMYHQRILRRYAVEFWWPRVALIVLGGIVAGIAGQFVIGYPIYVLAPIGALVVLFLLARNTQFGLWLVAITSTAIAPQAFTVKALSVFPAIPLLIWLFFVLLVQGAFRVKEFILPSFWAIWPLLGMASLAIISDIMIQLTWQYGVPHKIGSEPVILDEIYGIALYFLPLMIVAVTTAALTDHEHWIEYIQRGFLTISAVLGVVVVIQFKRIGADINSFRFSEPKLAWMTLKAISQILALGVIIAYARLLYAKRWRMRLLYGGILVISLVGVYVCLQNSWWLEVAGALAVMTFVYSRKLFVGFCLAAMPLLPLVKAEIDKLTTVKSADFYRLIIWQDSLRVWRLSPLLGVGPGNFWAYDQRYTQLPFYLRDFSKTGLGVSHNGYLQTLGELGIPGLFLYVTFMVVVVVISLRLYRRSSVKTHLNDRMLGLVSLGLVVGSAFGDFTAGAMFLQPRQVGSSSSITQVISTWIIFGCVMYKDQLWRMAHRGWKGGEPAPRRYDGKGRQSA